MIGSGAARSKPSRPRPRGLAFTPAAGAVALALGLTGLLAWHAGVSGQLPGHPTLGQMRYNTALSFALCGMGMLGLGLRRRGLAVVPPTIAATIAAVTVAEYLLGIDAGIDQLLMRQPVVSGVSHPGRMAPNTALCFLLGGSCLALLAGWRRPRPWAALPGAVVAAFALVSLLGYATGIPGTYGWGGLTQMSLQTAAGFVVVGLGIFAAGWGQTSPRPAPFLPVSVGLATMVVTVCLWQAMTAQSAERVRLVTESKARDLADHTRERLRYNLGGITRMAARWTDQRGLSPTLWSRDAERLLDGFPTISTIALISGRGSTIMRVDRETVGDSPTPWALDGPGLHQIELAATGEAVCAYRARTGDRQEPAVIAACPVELDGLDHTDGFLVAVIPERAFLQAAHKSFLPDCEVVVLGGGPDGGRPAPGSAVARCELSGAAWEFAVTLRPAFAQRLHSGWTDATLALGTLVALSGASLVWLMQCGERARSRQRSLLRELDLQKRALGIGADPSITPRERMRRLLTQLAGTLGLVQTEHTGPHGVRVRDLSLAVARWLGLDPLAREALAVAAEFHDIGKVGIPEDLLGLPRGLSPDERRFIDEHSRFGAELMEACGASPEAIAAVADHHARYDSDDLTEPPTLAAVLNAADAVDSMTSVRPYHRPRRASQALAELRHQRGLQFHPDVVDVMHFVGSDHLLAAA